MSKEKDARHLSKLDKIKNFLKNHWKGLGVVGIISLIAAVLGIWAFFFHDPAQKSDIQKTEKTITDTVVASQAKTQRAVEDVKFLIEEYQKTNHTVLMRKYPLGYAIIYTFVNSPVVYVSKDLLDVHRIEVNLAEARIDLSKSYYDNEVIIIPEIRHIPNNISIVNFVLDLPRKEGSKRGAVAIYNCEIWIETLISDEEKLVCIIGIRESKGERDAKPAPLHIH